MIKIINTGVYEELQILTYLEAIYNKLQMLDKRISDLEKYF